jgi:replicative DNA helicase
LGGLDRALGGGLQPRRLVVLLGAPGSGKTTLANQIAEHVADGGRPVVYLTTEDPPSALLAKTVARLGGLDYGAVLQGRSELRDRIDATLAHVCTRTSAARLLYVEETGRLSLDGLEAIARAHFARYADAGAGLLVVDYLQRWARAQQRILGNGAREELRIAVTLLTERLRGVARDLDCTVLALASQNRASGYGAAKGDAGSALASAKESGDVEYTADVLMAIGEDRESKRTPPLGQRPYTLRIDKNRQGEVRHIALDWYPVRQQFTEAAQ